MRTLLVLFTTLFYLPGFSQTVTASVDTESLYRKHIYFADGEEKTGFPDGDNTIQVEVYGIKQKMYAITPIYGHSDHSLLIRKVDANGNEIKVNKLENGEKVFGPLSTVAVEFHNKILLFYYRFLDKSRMELFQSEIDKNSLSLINTKSLYQFPLTKPNSLRMNQMYKALLIKISPNKSKLLVAAAGLNDQLFTSVMDQDMKVIQTKVSNVKGTEISQMEDASIANNGTIAAVFKKYESSTLNQASQFKALCGWVMGADQKELLVNFEKEAAGGELFHPTMLMTADGSKVVFGGDYNGQHYKEGIWLSEIATTPLKENKLRRIAYTPELLEMMEKMGFGDKRKGMIGMNATEYQLVELPNNQYLLGGSPEGVVDSRNSGGNNNRNFYTGPIIMAFVDQQKKATFTTIPRHNRDGRGSYSLFIPYKNKVILLYNDFEESLNAPYNPDKIVQKGYGNIKELSLGAAVVGENRQVEWRKMIAPGVGRMQVYEIINAVRVTDNLIKVPASGWDLKKKLYELATVRIN